MLFSEKETKFKNKKCSCLIFYFLLMDSCFSICEIVLLLQKENICQSRTENCLFFSLFYVNKFFEQTLEHQHSQMFHTLFRDQQKIMPYSQNKIPFETCRTF